MVRIISVQRGMPHQHGHNVAMPRLVIAAATAILLATVHLAAQERRPIRETDLLDFVWIADPQIAPDGTAVAFVRVVADRERNTYSSSIWVVPSGGGLPRALTTGTRDTAPRWSPDGRRLGFLRPVEMDGRPRPQVFSLDMTGGEPVRLTSMPEGVGSFSWSPDAQRLAVGSYVRAPPSSAPEPGRPKPSDARVVTRATFRNDGAGFLDTDRQGRVFVVDLAGGNSSTPRPLGQGRFNDRDPVWSPDGTRLYFIAQTVVELDYDPPRMMLVEADPVAGTLTDLAAIEGAVSQLSPSPDGSRVAFIAALNGRPVRSYSQSDLLIVDRASRAVTNLTERYDYDIGDGLSGDQRAPRGASSARPVWTADGGSLLTISGVNGTANLVRVDAHTGAAAPLTSGDREVQGFTAAREGRLALLSASPVQLPVVQVFAPAAAAPPQTIADPNAALFGTLDLPGPEAFWVRSFDGTRVQGWILKPPGFVPSNKYPAILQIHGGPHAAYGATFTHEFSWMAARGYVVIYTNPRGSTTYGQQFGNVIQHHYPGDDYRDLMAALDEVVGRGYVDTTRVGVTGGSGGGLLTNWALTRTTRFKAAVSQRSIADWAAWWYSADFTLFTPRWFAGPPWREGKDFTRRSPITDVDRITTPLMLVDGDEDHRTPPAAGGEAMFRALKLRKVPVVMVRFPEEGHELSRSGAPWRRIDRLRHIVAWFDTWLLGKSHPEYDNQ